MNIKKGQYYRFDGPNAFTVKALDNSYGDTFRAVVVLQGNYTHEVGHISNVWSIPSFVESDLSEFLEEANKRYPMGGRYVSLGGDPEGIKGLGVSYVEYEPKIWYYGDELRGVEVGNYVVYNFCIDKWAKPINDQVNTEETLIEAEFDLTTHEGRLAYAKKYYQIGTKVTNTEGERVTIEEIFFHAEHHIRLQIGEGLIYDGDKNEWAEIIKEEVKETNMEKQKLSRQGLKEIYSVACPTWKTTLEQMGSRNPLEDYIEISQDDVDRMFNACTKEQLPIVSKYLKQDDGSVNVMLHDTESLIPKRIGGEHENKAFALHQDYNWEIKKDNFGFICLIPTKKK